MCCLGLMPQAEAGGGPSNTWMMLNVWLVVSIQHTLCVVFSKNIFTYVTDMLEVVIMKERHNDREGDDKRVQ